MTFDDILEQVIALLKRQGRVSYGALRRRYDLDEAYLEDLKDEIIHAQCLAVDEDNRLLVWAESAGITPESTSQPGQSTQPDTQEAQPIHEASPPIEPHTPDAERRQLTVMFCDLVGSTELSGQMDAEDYRELVRAYQTTCGDVIERFDCHIAQTLGDGLLIYSGYPVAHENDAERAVRVGLGIMAAMGALNSRLEQDKGIRLAVRVGIHTGPVVVGEVGAGTRQEQLALGEVPNVAARIEGIAEPDTMVISEATYRLVEGYFASQKLGAQTLRGVAEPIAVYRVLSESGAQSRLDIVGTRGLTPLVGREQEAGLLLERWEQVKDGQGQVVLLSGEAGIGKSRLVQVLKDHASAEGSHTRLECRSSPYFTNSALYPVIDLIQRTLGWQQDDTPELRLEKLEHELKQYRMPLEESVSLFASLLSLPISDERYPPLTFSPQLQRQKTLEAILAIILELAERQPMLFIVEDLHWTDPTTLELLEQLIDQTPTASLYALLTCRPEFHPRWSHRSYLTEVTVNRLSQNQIARMAEQIAAGKRLPADVLNQVVEKTDGVPLFVEEMTKAVLESGVVKETNGQYELVGSIASLSIPSTLQDSLMSRLDRLVTAKGIAQLGSVIGRQFSYELLHAVSELDEATLQRELGRLVEAELVYQRGVVPGATYIFKHALIQDTAYESLLRSTRQQYHAQIAHVLEAQFADIAQTQPELLAHHFTEAGHDEQAVDYWHKAGQMANERSANVEAIAHLNQGLGLLQTLADTPLRTQRELALQITLGPALIVTKGYGTPEVEHTYARARELCEQVGDTPQLFIVLRGLWNRHFMRVEYPQARELGEQLLDLAQRAQDSTLLVEAHRALGSLLFAQGELGLAYEHTEQGIALYDRQQHRTLAFRYGADSGLICQYIAALTLWLRGYPSQARARMEGTLTLAQELSHPHSLAFVMVFATSLYQFRREVQVAYELANTVTTLASEHELAQWLAGGTILRGGALAAQGQREEGVSQLRQGLDAWRAAWAEVIRPYWLTLLAEAHGESGQYEEALGTLNEALSVVDRTGERYCEAEMHRLKGKYLLQQLSDNQPEAESCFHKALEVARHQEAKSWELRAATSLARLWQSQDKRDEARELLEPVYSWFTEGFDTADLIDAKALLDELS